MDGWLRALTIAIVLGALSACSDDSADMAEEPPQVVDETPAAASESSYEMTPEQDEAEAQEAASPSFMGYDCTDDCSGHEAGYQWAEEQGIDDPSDCGGNSNSFIEGCEAYAEEQ